MNNVGLVFLLTQLLLLVTGDYCSLMGYKITKLRGGGLVLRGIFSETTYVGVLTYQIPHFKFSA